MQRLQKLLARAGLGSRRKCEEIIRAGRVTVNGEVVTRMGARASADDDIRVDGQPIELPSGHVYLKLNKPPGYVTTRDDPQGRPTVMDLVPAELRTRVFPVGRLDLDTTGLLLLTDDGELAQRLIHPSHHVPKEYVVDVEGTPGEGKLHRMRHGLRLDDGFTQPCEVTLLDTAAGESRLRVIIQEGRNRQVRRMFEAIGHPVRRLKRVALGPLGLGELSLGEVRELTPAQVAALREAVQLPPGDGEDHE
ncbi:MAG: rRNA pseudouridine synthase [Armatimonadetes bacterium]|nr:rRNA pseudouridine synthase [Armatimonadota bacterium]